MLRVTRVFPFSESATLQHQPHKGSFKDKTSGVVPRHQHLNSTFDHSETKNTAGYSRVWAMSSERAISRKELAFASGGDCHKDEHKGQFAKRPEGIECTSCHNVNRGAVLTRCQGARQDRLLLEGHAKVKFKAQLSHS